MNSGSGQAVQAAANGFDGSAIVGAGFGVLAVRRLSVSDFRCYAGLRIEVDACPVVLTGANGAGKTNLLEAISFLSPGRGLRRARLSEVTRRPASAPWAVAANISGPEGAIDIGTGLAASDGADEAGERRVVKLDGELVSGPSQLAEITSVSWLTPQMDRLFVEGASGRRRFLDRLVFGLDPLHARRVAAYEKAMRERTKVLKAGRVDPAWAAALESTMAEGGVAVAAARREAVARLDAALAAAGGRFPRALLRIEGVLESWLDTMPALEAEDRFRARLAEVRGRDAEAGGAVEGPHRSDLKVAHAMKGMPAELCSTGEQKALLIAIVLANVRLQAARRSAVPILLLDEVAAHLDLARRTALFAEIAELGAQAWLTGTDAALFEAMRGYGQFFTVRDGRVIG
jgi:DNA replication and repair protein RecF